VLIGVLPAELAGVKDPLGISSRGEVIQMSIQEILDDAAAAWELFKLLWEGNNNNVPSEEYRASVIRQGRSGLPGDQFVNTFYFIADSDKAVGPANISAALIDFYEATTGQTFPINYYLSDFLTQEMMVKVYKMSDPHSPGPPKVQREPIVFLHTYGGSHGHGSMPEEVAVCLSFSGATPHTARRRGRVYLGPLSTTVLGTDTSSEKSVVLGAMQSNIAIAAKRLANHTNAGWLVRSSVGTDSYAAVETGWVDNAFDTQRRRGPDATSRFTWSKF
jgi:hypothetical protein